MSKFEQNINISGSSGSSDNDLAAIILIGAGGLALALFWALLFVLALALSLINIPGMLIVYIIDSVLNLSLDTGQFWTFSISATVLALAIWAFYAQKLSDDSDGFLILWVTPNVLLLFSTVIIFLFSHFGFHAGFPTDALFSYFPVLKGST